jgi:hypothetical protein
MEKIDLYSLLLPARSFLWGSDLMEWTHPGSRYQTSEPCQRVAAVEGIGPLTATALVAAMSTEKLSRTVGSSLPGYQPYYPAVVVEHRYIVDIVVAGIQNDGLAGA